MAERLSIQILSLDSGVTTPSKEILLKVQVTLDCGLPVCAGGRFDASRFRVTARFFHNDINILEKYLNYTGNSGEFEGAIPLKGPGSYIVEVNAYDPETGLAGRNNLKFSLKAGG